LLAELEKMLNVNIRHLSEDLQNRLPTHTLHIRLPIPTSSGFVQRMQCTGCCIIWRCQCTTKVTKCRCISINS